MNNSQIWRKSCDEVSAEYFDLPKKDRPFQMTGNLEKDYNQYFRPVMIRRFIENGGEGEPWKN